MRFLLKIIFLLTFLAVSSVLTIKADLITDFENNEDYKDIGVYDVWEDSPFRTGELEGNFEVVENPFLETKDNGGEGFNNSNYVLGAQRSRYGSNRFGVRVDLKEPFELSPDSKFIHVLIHRPKEGRVMLVGLGSREERLHQNPMTEQFYVVSSNKVKTDCWDDAVFEIKGAEGVLIRSLVIAPDCESPHDLEEDFLFYIDDIEINENPLPRI